MRTTVVSLIVAAAVSSAAPAWAAEPPDPLTSLGCLQCHSILGGSTAPPFAKRLLPVYTVPALAATMWNHTPAMWAEISTKIAKLPTSDEAMWRGAFQSLYVLQFSEPSAFTALGEATFRSRCATCHDGTDARGKGTPLAKWTPLGDPLSLVWRMWDHAASMKPAFQAKGRWQKLDARDFLNLTSYIQMVQNVPRQVTAASHDLAQGRLLTAQYCGSCHAGSNTFAAELPRNRTLMDIGAATWNHVGLARAVPVISANDFAAIVEYVWELSYQGPAGSVAKGERTFETKGCLSCHRSPSEKKALSPRPGGTFTPYSLVALGWGQGREMHRQILEKGMPWPKLAADDVPDSVAYLNTLAR